MGAIRIKQISATHLHVDSSNMQTQRWQTTLTRKRASASPTAYSRRKPSLPDLKALLDALNARPGAGMTPELLLKVLSTPATINLIGVSPRTWARMHGEGDVPVKTQISEGRVGYRVLHVLEWLEARRRVLTPITN